MVIRETPKNKDKFIYVNNEIGDILQKNGFSPKYMDFNYLYFIKTKEIEIFMEREGLI